MTPDGIDECAGQVEGTIRTRTAVRPVEMDGVESLDIMRIGSGNAFLEMGCMTVEVDDGVGIAAVAREMGEKSVLSSAWIGQGPRAGN